MSSHVHLKHKELEERTMNTINHEIPASIHVSKSNFENRITLRKIVFISVSILGCCRARNLKFIHDHLLQARLILFQLKWIQPQTGLLNTLLIDPGMIRRLVTLATQHLLDPLYHCEKMLDTEGE